MDASENPLEKDLELILNPNVSMDDIVNGNSEVGEAGIGLAGIREACIPITLDMSIEDKREGMEGFAPQEIPSIDAEDIANSPVVMIDPGFYDTASYLLGFTPSGSGTIENHLPEYVYATNLKNILAVTCNDETPDLGYSSDFTSYGPHEDPEPEDIDAGTEDDGGVDVIEDAGVDTESDIPTDDTDPDTGAGDVDADTDADADSDVDTDTGTGDIDVEDSGLPDEEPDTDEEEEDGGPSGGGTF
jgi:hypothetical protein